MINLTKRKSFDIILLIGALVLALVFRLIRLGHTPLQDSEAEIALQALAAAEGSDTRFGSHMAVVGLTALDFFVFTSSNFLARFWTAIFGVLIVLVPFLLRKQLGEKPAIILSFVLAIAPDMVGLSRLIGSPLVGLVCLLLALVFFSHRKPILFGVSLALGLMGGASFWFGITILGVSFFLATSVFHLVEDSAVRRMKPKQDFWLRGSIAFGITLAVVGTGFFLAPAGLSGIFTGLTDFMQGFGGSYYSPYFHMPLVLAAYAAPAVLFGIWGSLRSAYLKSKPDLFLTIWWLVGLAFILLYPGSKPADMIWISLPLWALSARVIYFKLRLPERSRLVVTATVVMVVVVLAFVLLTLRAILGQSMTQQQQLNSLIALIGGLFLIIALVLLVNFGWSTDVAFSGFLIGLLIVFLVNMVSLSVNTTGLAPELSHEIWYQDGALITTEWLERSLGRVISWNAQRGEPLEILVANYQKPGMEWVLRGYDEVYFVSTLPPTSQAGILITDELSSPQLSEGYRGQDLVWERKARWAGLTAFQYLDWLVTREAPTTQAQVIFWVRTDLMPDEQFSP